MTRAKTKNDRVPLNLRVPAGLKTRLELIAADIGCSVNAWAIQALAKSAKNHIPFEDFINQAPTRGRGKNTRQLGRLTPFIGLPVDELGVPEGVNLADGELELHRKLKEGGPAGLALFMEMLWKMAKIDQPYTEQHLAETLRVLSADD